VKLVDDDDVVELTAGIAFVRGLVFGAAFGMGLVAVAVIYGFLSG
jgi:hypothetical protein